MIGAIIGDIVGSVYEFNNIKTKDFELFKKNCFFTDDTVMTIAIGRALLDWKNKYGELPDKAKESMRKLGRIYPNAGYGHHFYRWLFSDDPKPYGSYGNGASMRVSACGVVGKTLQEVIDISRMVTEITHDHPDGIKAAEATAVAVFLARNGKSKEEIQKHIIDNYYPLDFTLDGIRKDYVFDATALGTTPQALKAFFESTCFEDAIRCAISIGGDSDTIGAITGAVAGAYYGIPREQSDKAREYLDDFLLHLLEDFEKAYPPKII
ncbi:MAG TPA: ADP-ribosylglycohydrolase family protein [Bacillota bacterium]|nr:ADP-ribosylglycohydrolase family protein [Bacillota bacterium]HPF41947.1 ADP-ribosylglycohydrolase family protein [Bacillota bacterium]HPJ85580.1 ADP-ribosylglycohydrolase family protein [Bacillota bacterium]HPQ61468.1 ADP-ribosylglycohydrolase family protein [Bacillota bacterium]HRX91722.1 ADP-ribosylglycohydrolase family protein [Candidatus Izemoplasmatales bacterium]